MIAHTEHALLGALMHDGKCWHEVATIVGATDYADVRHSVIHMAIGELVDAERKTDVLTVCEHLENQGKLGKAGGMPYVGEIARNNPTAGGALSHAKHVKSAARLRHIRTIAGRVMDACGNDVNDPDIILDNAITELTRMITETERNGLKHITEHMAVAIDEIENAFYGKQIGYGTGLDDLDKMTGRLRNGELIVIAARPSQGKTALALQIAMEICKEASPLMFSLEMPGAAIAQRLLAMHAHVNLFRLRNGLISDPEWPRITVAVNVVNKLPFYVDDSSVMTVNDIGARARIDAARLQRDGARPGPILIDYLQLIRMSNRQSKAEAIGETTRALKALAKDLDTPVLLLSQLNRESERRTDRRPTLADLRGSGDIEQDADLVVMIHRDMTPEQSGDPDCLVVAKNRNGPTGDVQVDFDKARVCFVGATDRQEAVKKARESVV